MKIFKAELKFGVSTAVDEAIVIADAAGPARALLRDYLAEQALSDDPDIWLQSGKTKLSHVGYALRHLKPTVLCVHCAEES